MEKPSKVVRGFYKFCRKRMRQIRKRRKIAKLLGEAFTIEQAFWIHVVSMALCTWDDDAEHEIRLSEIFRVYLTIYREEIDRNLSLENESPWDDDAEHEIRLSKIWRVYLTIYREEIERNMSLENETLFLKVLKYKYDKANKIMHEEEDSKAGLHLAHLALGKEVNVIRLTLAALDIPSGAAAISPLPFRLVEDI